MAKMSVDNKLGLDRFVIDKNNPHITLNTDYENEKQINQLVMSCPAGLYHYEDGRVTFNHEGCLECGTCRVLSKGKVVKKWSYPMGGMGIEFRQG